MSFNKLNLGSHLEKCLKNNKYKVATKIQAKVIPLILKGHDIMAKAQTGSGKTASFVLPILKLLMEKPPEKKQTIKVLVLTPTRELTLQVANTFLQFNKFLPRDSKVVTLIGGESIGEQLIDIQKGCEIVVATSGRLIDIIDKKQINLNSVEYFILDEADKMLDFGFAEELDTILLNLSQKRQNLLFSATYPSKILNISSKITNQAIEVIIDSENQIVEDIQQRVIEVNRENRSALLRYLIKVNKWDKILVFMANKRASDNIAQKFRKYGLKAESFHGDLTQEERNYTLIDFKEKDIKILFATDIASRGLHIDDIDCVVNFDLPRSADDYIHRIGRTGRAGIKGTSITFIGAEDIEHFKLIEKRCNINLYKEQIDGFELTGEIIGKQKGNAPIKGKRKSKKDKLRELQKLLS